MVSAGFALYHGPGRKRVAFCAAACGMGAVADHPGHGGGAGAAGVEAGGPGISFVPNLTK